MPPAPTPDLSRELALTVDAARRAGAIQLQRYGRRGEVQAKGPRDVVTEADHLSEALILGAIREAFPDDAMVAEESGHHHGGGARDVDPTAGRGRTWIVDPLDGTINYANGLPIWCVSIGLAIDGRAVLGVIYDPSRDELFSAVAGGGAHFDGARLRLPVREKLADCLITLALPRRGYGRRRLAIERATRVNRVLGSSALALAYVASGRFDVFVQARGLSIWDVAAAGVIAEEAGATVTDLQGGPWLDVARASRTVGVVAAAPAHHAALLRLLAGTAAAAPTGDAAPAPAGEAAPTGAAAAASVPAAAPLALEVAS